MDISKETEGALELKICAHDGLLAKKEIAVVCFTSLENPDTSPSVDQLKKMAASSNIAGMHVRLSHDSAAVADGGEVKRAWVDKGTSFLMVEFEPVSNKVADKVHDYGRKVYTVAARTDIDALFEGLNKARRQELGPNCCFFTAPTVARDYAATYPGLADTMLEAVYYRNIAKYPSSEQKRVAYELCYLVLQNPNPNLEHSWLQMLLDIYNDNADAADDDDDVLPVRNERMKRKRKRENDENLVPNQNFGKKRCTKNRCFCRVSPSFEEYA
jgi:hypothetical protein